MTQQLISTIEVRNLSKTYGRSSQQRNALRDVSFAIGSGEVVGLLGPNGSGKSTALSILAGILAPTSGCVYYDGQVQSHHPTREFRRRLGVVFQSPSLDAKLSARTNLLLAAKLFGEFGPQVTTRVEDQLTFAGLSDRGNDRVSLFSGGMKRRLDIARALLSQPQILLMDEPTAGLDESAFRATWQMLKQWRDKTPLTIVVATHRPEEAAQCDRLIVINQGKIVSIATPEQLMSQVGDDVVVVQAEDCLRLQDELRDKLHLTSVYDGQMLTISTPLGHQVVPRLIEAFPAGRIESISVRRPSLADAFLKLTGDALSPTSHQTNARE